MSVRKGGLHNEDTGSKVEDEAAIQRRYVLA